MIPFSNPGRTLDGRHIVVLGGLGFIGSHLCRALLAKGCLVTIFDKLYSARELITDIEPRLKIVEGDFSRPDDVLCAIDDSDTLIHLVHTTVPGSSMQDPAQDILSNVAASVMWLRRLSETAIRQILYVSSGGTVYGVPQRTPIDERHATNPICSYGIKKLAIEKYVAIYASMFDIDYIVARPSNVYGVGQRLNIGQGIIGVMTNRALHGQALELWGNAKNVRDYLYIDDLISALLLLLEHHGEDNIFNVSSAESCSVLDIVSILTKQLGFTPQIVRKPSRGFDVPVNILDSSLLRILTGWRPKVSMQEGIKRTIEWARELHSIEKAGL